MGDNFHQSVKGGTGANHVVLGIGDAIWYSDGERQRRRRRRPTRSRTRTRSPAPTTGIPRTATRGGTYTDCADPTQPGVGAGRELPASAAVQARREACCPDAYYLLNNYNPGYLRRRHASTPSHLHHPAVSRCRTIGDALERRQGLLDLLRRGLERLRRQSEQRDRHDLLQHLQSVPVRRRRS